MKKNKPQTCIYTTEDIQFSIVDTYIHNFFPLFSYLTEKKNTNHFLYYENSRVEYIHNQYSLPFFVNMYVYNI